MRNEAVASLITMKHPKLGDKLDENGQVTWSCGRKTPIASVVFYSNIIRHLSISSELVGDKKLSVLRDTECTGMDVRRDIVSSIKLIGEVKLLCSYR